MKGIAEKQYIPKVKLQLCCQPSVILSKTPLLSINHGGPTISNRVDTWHTLLNRCEFSPSNFLWKVKKGFTALQHSPISVSEAVFYTEDETGGGDVRGEHC